MRKKSLYLKLQSEKRSTDALASSIGLSFQWKEN